MKRTYDVMYFCSTCRKFYLLITIAIACILTTTGRVHSAEFGEPYIISDGEGLYPSDVKYDNGYRIPIYLPHGSLFFVDNSRKERNDQVQIISKFGQKYFIDKKKLTYKTKNGTVRERTVNHVYGDQHYVFHRKINLCSVSDEEGNRYPDCNKSIVTPIRVGSVAENVTPENSLPDYRELKFNKFDIYGNDKIVFIKKEELDYLIARGVVTDLKQEYPRFLRQKPDKDKYIIAECGIPETYTWTELREKLDGTEIDVNVSFGFLFFGGRIKDLKNVSTSDIQEKQSKIVIGGDDYGIEHFVLTIKDIDEKKMRKFDIETTTKCVKESSDKPKIYISKLRVYEDGAHFFSIKFSDLYDWPKDEELVGSAPYKVWETNNERYFFTSINSPSDYWNIHMKFYEKIEDADLANLFISEFNASCSHTEGKGDKPYKICSDSLPAKK